MDTALAVLVSVVWGGAFIATKVGLDSFTPAQLTALRFLLACLIVLDPFCGLGSSIVAGQRTGRRVYALEREPRLVDVAVRRWQALSGAAAVHAATGRTFKEVVDEEGTAKTVVRPADAEPPSVATVPPRIAGCDKNPAQRGE